MKNVFIGGTGRSGTTILAQALARDPRIYSFPTELRFITDPDGLIDLKSALVDEWSFYRADFAIDRFKELMNKLSTKYFLNYPNSNLNSVVGEKFLKEWTDSFLSEFYFDYSHNNWAGRATLFSKIITKKLSAIKFLNVLVPKSYYSSPIKEENFKEKLHHHLDLFFQRASDTKNADIIIDHTPTNLIHAKFLKFLYDDLKLIHIYRDPRDVISSYATRDWGNSKFEYNVKWVFNILEKWDEQKIYLDESNYLEIKFEDFVHNFSEKIENVYNFIGEEIPKPIQEMDLSKHNIGRWKNSLTTEQNNFIIKNYSKYFEKYNFEF